MKSGARPPLLAMAFAVPATYAHANDSAAPFLCSQASLSDSVPSSRSADGWSAVDGPVTGGCGATPSRVHHVRDRAQLVAALTKGNAQDNIPISAKLDQIPKIIYVHGTIDLNVNDQNEPLCEEDYMHQCSWTAHATYYDPTTGDQSGSGGFFGAYKAAYGSVNRSIPPTTGRRYLPARSARRPSSSPSTIYSTLGTTASR
jgi:pectate lyase